MKFLNSVLETIKKYWYILAIAALTLLVLIVSFLENSKLAGLVRLLNNTSDNYKKQVETIDKLADKKSKKDKQATKSYEDKAKEIQAKREADLAKVNAKKIELVEELKDKSTEELANKLKEEFKL